jgi:hypothetical protein
MITTDDDYQSYPLVKQSKVRKLRTYTSSTSSSGSSTNNSPNVNKQKLAHHTGDTDEGYASFTTTNSTTLGSNNSTTLNKDDSAYYTSASERLFNTTLTSSSSSRIIVENDSDRSDISDHDDDHDDDDILRDLVDWPLLNQQVQTLVSRLDNWLHNPLPDRYIPIKKPYVEHAYPILQRQIPSMPLSINLSHEETNRIPNQSNYLVNFVQNNDISQQQPTVPFRIPRPRVHFNLEQTEKVFIKIFPLY